MKNYTKTNVGTATRTELHDALSLTGAEVSINQLPAGAGAPSSIPINTTRKSTV